MTTEAKAKLKKNLLATFIGLVMMSSTFVAIVAHVPA